MAARSAGHRTDITVALIGLVAALGVALVSNIDKFSSRAEKDRVDTPASSTAPSVTAALHNYLMPGTADYPARIAMATQALMELRLEPDANLTPEQRLHQLLNEPGQEQDKSLLALNIMLRDPDRQDTILLDEALRAVLTN